MLVNAPFSGLQDAIDRFNKASENIANVNTEGYDKNAVAIADTEGNAGGRVSATGESGDSSTDLNRDNPSNVNLAEEMINLMQASQQFKANAKVISERAEMEDVMLRMFK